MTKSSTEDLIRRAHEHGVTLWVEAGTLKFRATSAGMPDDLRRQLSEHRAEVISFLCGIAGATPSSEKIPRAARDGALPLSFAQERLWFLDQLTGRTMFRERGALELTGSLDVAALNRALSYVIERHELLRATVVVTDGKPGFVVRSPQPVTLSVTDLRDSSDWRGAVQAVSTADGDDRELPMSLALFRAPETPTGEPRHVLLSGVHHMFVDMWSMGVFAREISHAYDAYASSRQPDLPPLDIQYIDYAAWQREQLSSAQMKDQLEFWKKYLDGAARTLDLPTDFQRPPLYAFEGDDLPVRIPKNEIERLNDLCRRQGATLFMGLLASLAVVLSRYTSQHDIVIGTPVANRRRREVEGLIGFFANTLPMRVDASGDVSFETLLARVKQSTLSAFEHQDVPFERIVEEAHPERDPSHTPLVQVMLALQNTPQHALNLHGLSISTVDLGTTRTRFDLTLEMWSDEDGLTGRLEFNTTLFRRATVERLIGHLREVIVGVTTASSAPLSSIALLSSAETRDRDDWTTVDSKPCPSVVRAFAAAVTAHSNRTAITSPLGEMTYRELDTQSRALARRLRAAGAGQERIVGIALERSPAMVVAVLAVLKSGSAFLPLDPSYPAQRTKWMLEDAAPVAVITQASLVGTLPPLSCPLIVVDDAPASEADQTSSSVGDESGSVEVDAQADVDADQLAYVIFTSGSTGRPKGVMVSHGALANYLCGSMEEHRLGPGDRMLPVASLNFDISIAEILLPLLSGATIHMEPADALMPGPELERSIRENNITHVQLSPTALSMMSPDRVGDLRQMQVGGETCHVATADAWARGRRFINEYGPTEATIFVTTAEHHVGDKILPIGRPIQNISIEILDAFGHRSPIGIPGRLFIGGVGLSRGYSGRPSLTAERFVPDPYGTFGPGSRLYDTGDVAKFLEDGQIDFIGRADHQLKLRGVRVELGEIESALKLHASIRDAVVVTEGTSSNMRVVACCLVEPGASLHTAELRQFLATRLLEPMIPSLFVSVDEFPRTPAGKVDRAEISKSISGKTAVAASSDVVMPRNTRELELAEIWQDVLNVWPISVTSDFFELGGHSYLAVRLITRVNAAFGSRLPLASLFQNSTIEKLAFALRDSSVAWSPLVALQPRGTRPPLFCIHPAGGAVFAYARMAPLLGFDQPVYGLQERGIEPGVAPYADVHEMAAAYVSAIRAVQPNGPYQLLGWSAGGSTAFEMAVLLERDGQHVSRLIMIDSPATTGVTFEQDDVKFLVERLRPGGIALADLDAQPTEEAKVAYAFEEIRKSLPETLTFDTADAVRFLKLHKHHNRIMSEYRPSGKIAGAIQFLKALDAIDYDAHQGDPLADWPTHTSGHVAIDYVPGNHFNLFEPGYIDTLAAKVTELLAQPRSTSACP